MIVVSPRPHPARSLLQALPRSASPTPSRLALSFGLALALGLSTLPAQAQGTAKAPAKAAKAPKGKSKPQPTAAAPADAASAVIAPGGMLAREDLRRCMTLESSYKARSNKVVQGDEAAKAERDALLAEETQLKADKASLDLSNEAAVTAFNARVVAREQRVDAWNAAHRERSKEADAARAEHETWKTDCAGRRFREEDEMAIRQGR